jgi:anionic cell wall polymer biosynthesis LytR-Cps2A-Psr (LCP) family protein
MKERQIKTDASVFLLAVIVVLVCAGIFFTFIVLRSDPIDEAISNDRVINTLFVFESEGAPIASYVLMYYSGTKRAVIFDIPSEVGLIIKRFNRVGRIDTVYKPSHITAFESEIESLLGIDINFFIVYDLFSLEKIIDFMEGVELFIPVAVSVYEPNSLILLPSGVTQLDGDKARLFLTYQLPDEGADLVSFRRQRFFLAFINSLGKKNQVMNNPYMLKAVQLLVKTDMNKHTRLRFFDELANINMDKVGVQSVGGNYREVSGQTLLFPYYDGSLIKEVVRQSLGVLTRQTEGSLTERIFTVEILNGTGIPGLAGRTAELLRGFGYDVTSIGNASHSDYEATEIIDTSGSVEGARLFSEIIRCTNLRSETVIPEDPDMKLNMDLQNLDYRSDFTLIIGRDFDGRYVTGK